MDCLQLFIAGCQRITVIERTAVKIRHDDVLICFSEILITWQRHTSGAKTNNAACKGEV